MSNYDIPRPSRINLKETRAEKEARIYAKEKRRMDRERERIARANGHHYDPDSDGHRHSPRKRAHGRVDDEHAGHARQGLRQSRAAFVNDMDDVPDPEGQFGNVNMYNFMSGEMAGLRGGYFPPHIPRRFQHPPNLFPPPPWAGASFPSFGAPPMGTMSEHEYAAHIRAGMRASQRASDAASQAQRASASLQREEEAYRARLLSEEREEREREREAKRRRRARAEEAQRAAEAAARENAASRTEAAAAQKEERRRWRKRCATLFDTEIESVELRFADIPWPVSAARGSGFGIVLSPADLTTDNVKTFLFTLADEEGGKDARRKIIREAIRLFHSDRFHSRVLPRVKADERELVKEGVEIVARILTGLLSGQ